MTQNNKAGIPRLNNNVLAVMIAYFHYTAMSERRTRQRIHFPEFRDPDTLCSLCHSCHRHMSSPSEWKSSSAQQYVLSMKVPLHGSVCRPCRDDVTRSISNPTYTPRWRKEGGHVAHVYCAVKQCYNDMFTNTNVGGNREAPEHVQHLELKPNTPFPIPLCKAHYHVLYNAVRHTKYCRTCGRRLSPGGGRSCPNPKIIQEHLSQNTDFLGDISEQDLVCMTCYKSHLLGLRESKTTSTDSDMSALRKNAVVDIRSVHDVLDAAMNKTLL